MEDVVFLLTLMTSITAGLFMSWAIGAVAIGGGAFAPAVGAKAIRVRRAALVLGVVGFFGAILQGASVTETVGRGLVRGTALTPLAASVAILFSAVLMAIGAFGRYPIPAAFTVTGAMVGAGLGLGGTAAWNTYIQFAALWVLAPVLIAILSYGIATFLDQEVLPSRYTISIIVALVFCTLALLEVSFLGGLDENRSIAETVAANVPVMTPITLVSVPLVFAVSGASLGYQTVQRQGERVASQKLLIWLGVLVAFSGAGNQIGLAVGPMLPLLDSVGLPAWLVMVVAAAGLVAGAWTGAPRLIEAVAKEYAALSTNRAIAALVPAFLVAQIGILYGVPVSFNEIIIAAIIGSGLTAEEGISAINPRKMYFTVAAWIISLIGAFAITYGLVYLMGDMVVPPPAGFPSQ